MFFYIPLGRRAGNSTKRRLIASLVIALCFACFNVNAQAPDLEWQKTYGGTAADEARSVKQTTDGGFILAGKTLYTNGDVTNPKGAADFWIVKVNAAGTLQWQKTYGGTGNDEAIAVQQTTDGGYIVAGSTTSNNGNVTGNHGQSDFWVIKLDANGNLTWQRALGSSQNDFCYSVIQTTDGGYAVAGRVGANSGDVNG